MKQYVILTSVLALAACGGGSGGGGSHSGTPSSSVTPTLPPLVAPTALPITVQAFDGGTSVTSGNENVTNMSSYTLDYGDNENQTKMNIVTFVQNRLAQTGNRGGLLNRAATAQQMRSRNQNVDPEQFAAADLYIKNMKQVLYDMTQVSGTDLEDYVEANKENVVNALKLQNQNVNEDTETADLISAFDALGLTSGNIIAQMDAFDAALNVTKASMENVRLKDTGGEGFLKFALDESGQIESVSLLEDPMGEYGTSWANKKIIINGSGHAEAVAPDATWGLNPFGTEYLTDQAGVLNRDGTGTEFTNTVKSYEFTLGKYNEGEGALTLTSGHSVSSILQPDDFKKIELISEEALTPETAREKLVHYLIEKVNKKIHNQHGADNALDLQDAVEVVNWYINKIDSVMNSSFVATSFLSDVQQTATMHGMGTTDGVKLKYSDFGYAKLVRNDGVHDPETSYLTYTGGYDQRRMDNTPSNNNLENGATFTGTAVVTVEDEHEDKQNSSNDYKHVALYKDTNATLTYNVVNPTTARHTLTMNGLKATDDANNGATVNSDWYNVVVTGTENSNNMQVAFNANGKTIDSDFQFFKMNTTTGEIERNQADSVPSNEQIVMTNNGNPGHTINTVDGTTSTVEGHHRLNGTASAEYYGQDAANPTEATAGFWMDERYANDTNNIQHELSVYGAFGGQKNE